MTVFVCVDDEILIIRANACFECNLERIRHVSSYVKFSYIVNVQEIGVLSSNNYLMGPQVRGRAV